MAEEVFALSPISARGTSPTDADYDAIREAFLETARGRWFLGEYAKRNRNADTAMVLDAVARIEQSLAATKLAEPEPAPVSDPLADLREAFEAAQTAIKSALASSSFEAALAPWRRSSRIIQEIAWGLREAGADSRICDLMDNQVRAIDEACDGFPASDLREAVLKALELLSAHLGPGSHLGPDEPDHVHETEQSRIAEATIEPAAFEEIATTASPVPVPPSVAALDEVAAPFEIDDGADKVLLEADEFVLEIASPTVSDIHETPEPADVLPPTAQVVRFDGVSSTTIEETASTDDALSIDDDVLAPAISLGASLISQGIIDRPTAKPDLLAPIRRMSQAERIAFFS